MKSKFDWKYLLIFFTAVIFFLLGIVAGMYFSVFVFFTSVGAITDNMTLVIDIDEEKLVNYSMAFLIEDFKTEMEYYDMDNETRRLLDENITQAVGSLTVQDIVEEMGLE